MYHLANGEEARHRQSESESESWASAEEEEDEGAGVGMTGAIVVVEEAGGNNIFMARDQHVTSDVEGHRARRCGSGAR